MPTLAEVLREGGYIQDGKIVRQPSATAQKMNEYVKNIIPNALQNAANQRADIDAALTMGDKGIQIGDRAAFARQMAEVPNLMGAIAYHGTPHTIKGKFDISKVGTGEGAQAYGHGMYFAENPAVATQYKNILSKPEFTKTAEGVELRGQLPRMLDESYSELIAKNGIQQTNYGDVTDLVGQRLDRQMKDALKANDMDWYNKVADMKLDLARFKENPPPNVGNLYKVDIPDEYIPNMLIWEKSLREQPQILKNLGIDIKEYDKIKAQRQAMPEKFDIDIPEELAQYEIARKLDKQLNEMGVDKSGRYFYEDLIKKYGTQKAISEALAEKGIKGIQYFDAGSRGKAAERTRNYVVFDPSEVKILEQNSKPMTRKEIIEQELEKVAK